MMINLTSTSQPKGRFYTRLNEQDYLGLTIWSGKTDPTAEVIVVQLRRRDGDNWETVGRLAVYRTSNGTYSKLPERRWACNKVYNPAPVLVLYNSSTDYLKVEKPHPDNHKTNARLFWTQLYACLVNLWWAERDLNSRPFGYQPNALAMLSHRPTSVLDDDCFIKEFLDSKHRQRLRLVFFFTSLFYSNMTSSWTECKFENLLGRWFLQKGYFPPELALHPPI